MGMFEDMEVSIYTPKLDLNRQHKNCYRELDRGGKEIYLWNLEPGPRDDWTYCAFEHPLLSKTHDII